MPVMKMEVKNVICMTQYSILESLNSKHFSIVCDLLQAQAYGTRGLQRDPGLVQGPLTIIFRLDFIYSDLSKQIWDRSHFFFFFFGFERNNTFIPQEHIKLIKSESKDTYNVIKDLYFK